MQLVSLRFLVLILLSQGIAAPSLARGPSSTTAIRATNPPTIDGELADSVWQEVTWFRDFKQQRPEFGTDPSLPTEFAVAYDGTHIYLAIRCTITEEAPIVTRLTRRDRDGDMGCSYTWITDGIGVIFEYEGQLYFHRHYVYTDSDETWHSVGAGQEDCEGGYCEYSAYQDFYWSPGHCQGGVYMGRERYHESVTPEMWKFVY